MTREELAEAREEQERHAAALKSAVPLEELEARDKLVARRLNEKFEVLRKEQAETEQQKAEATLAISLDVLEKVYNRFAPDRMVESSSRLTVDGASIAPLWLRCPFS